MNSAIRSDTIVPPRNACATTVIASRVTARNHERRCPRRIPRASMIMAMPATAVTAAAEVTTASGTTESTRCK
jgi:hypothetical protein